MKPVSLDKIASVTLHCQLRRTVKVGPEIRCRTGDVLAVRIQSRKTRYDQLELTTGRFSRLQPGDVIAGALGPRRALCGYAGHVPEQLAPGDRVHLLNLGGVLGICDSYNEDVGPPFDCEVLGQVLHFPYLGKRVGVPAHIGQHLQRPLAEEEPLDTRGVPIVAVVGTCMNSGKTLACTNLIQSLVHHGLRVHGAKATGVSLRRDVLAMEDAGAVRTGLFTDLGVVTTSPTTAAPAARRLLSELTQGSPDVLVLELGDGLMGEYGVDAILSDPEIAARLTAVVLAAADPVGVWGALRLLDERYGLAATVVTGPATDNEAGTDVIQQRMNTPAFNARTQIEGLSACVRGACGLGDEEAAHVTPA